MMVREWVWVAAVVIVGVMVMGRADGQSSCEQSGSCACKTDQGWINLEALDSGDPKNPAFKDITDWSSNSYSYNPCSDFSYGGCTDVAVCQKDTSGTGYPCGAQESAKFGQDSSGQGFAITYSQTSGGVLRTSIVTLVCDANADTPTLSALGEGPTAFYDFTLTTKYACPGTAGPPSSGGGLSGGSILLIIFFVGLTVFLISGVLYNHFVKHATGEELIPFVSFWKSLPGYALDGVRFTIDKVKGLCDNRSSYDEI